MLLNHSFKTALTMKTLFAFFFLLLFPVALWGQEYLPFLEEGKVWTYGYHQDPFLDSPKLYQVTIGGDTVVSGVTCKKIMDNLDVEERCIGAFYEENGKVWAFYPDTYGKEQPAKLLYDFSCKEGDVLTNLVTGIDQTCEVKVAKVESVESFGIKRRLITLSLTPPPMRESKAYWLEGIGSRFDIYSTWVFMGAVIIFESCSLNGTTIADQSSFGPGNINGGNTGINTAKMHGRQSAGAAYTLFDLQGRRLKAKPAKGVYIQDGRKHVVR